MQNQIQNNTINTKYNTINTKYNTINTKYNKCKTKNKKQIFLLFIFVTIIQILFQIRRLHLRVWGPWCR